MVVAGASTHEQCVQWHWDVVPLQSLTGLELVPAEVASVNSAREQLAGHLMQDVDLLPAAKGNTRGWPCHSVGRTTMA